jgi:hypothetical protein
VLFSFSFIGTVSCCGNFAIQKYSVRFLVADIALPIQQKTGSVKENPERDKQPGGKHGEQNPPFPFYGCFTVRSDSVAAGTDFGSGSHLNIPPVVSVRDVQLYR